MHKKANQFCFLAGLIGLLTLTGCQSWHSSSVLPGLMATKGERLIVKQARNDPFPSPSDVGIVVGSDE